MSKNNICCIFSLPGYSAISIAEGFKKTLMNINKKVLVLSNLKDNFKKEIYDFSKEKLSKQFQNINFQCTGKSYDLGPSSMYLSKNQRMKEVAKKIKAYYEFTGYIKFANDIMKKTNKWDGNEKNINEEIKKFISKEFDDRVIIIDEIQNIKTAKKLKLEKTIQSILQSIIKYAKNIKLILMSATPMFDRADEIIFYLGQAYSLVHKNISETLLFNGSHLNNNTSFENYIKRLGYNFKNELNEIGGYVLLKNNKYALAMDIGSAPEKNFSRDYQAGALSFELISNKRKIITNSGYFQKTKHQLNLISKTTACQSTLSIQNHSSVQFTKHSDGSIRVNSPIKINNKKIISNKDYWSIEASHDGYNKRFGITHMRKIDFFHDTQKLVGVDRIQKKNNKSYNFEIRFHLIPETKIMKTQDNKTIYIDVHGEGWRFNSKNCNIDFETGLYFGLKNNFAENQNIVISGIVDKNDQEFTWELSKI